MLQAQPVIDSKGRRRRSYVIADSVEYRTVSFSTPAPDFREKRSEESAAYLSEHRVVDKRAIWIVHGMGQQVPFETLDSLAEGILSAATPGYPLGEEHRKPPRVRTVKFLSPDNPSNSQVVQRVEIDLPREANSTTKLELHLYEAYWAPLTEGVAKVSDVISFLSSAGIHGLLNSRKPFRRAMFPDDTSPISDDPNAGKCDPGFWNFRIPFRTPFFLGVVLLLLLAIIGIDAIITAASAAHLKASFFGPWVISSSSSPSVPQLMSANWNQLTAIATSITALALTFGAVLFLAEMSKPAQAPRAAKNAAVSVTLGIESFISYAASLFKAKGDKTDDEETAESRAEKAAAAKADMAGTTDPIVDSLWAAIIRYLSWTSLWITAVTILIGAACLALISWSSPIANWFRGGLRFRATQFVSTAAILFVVLLCLFAAWRRAALRSKGVDHRTDGTPRFLFVSAFLVHLALLCFLVRVQFHHYDPQAPFLWLQGFVNSKVSLSWLQTLVNSRILSASVTGVINLLLSPFWVWPSLLALSKLVRDVIVEYPGDVAIYVSPNKLDRFDEIRKKIKQLALDSLMPLYSARLDAANGSNVDLYSHVGVIGHSLGSVVAYDTLNKLLSLDQLLGNPFEVGDRTCIFETFGSPLDKIAFFFTFQGNDALRIREQLAASVQPLIQSYKCFRKFPWINVRSGSDIISGRLEFYDVNPPDSAAPPTDRIVKNVTDLAAIVPLIAHVEYWKNPTVWSYLFAATTAPPPSVSAPGPGASKQGASKLPPRAPNPAPHPPAIS